jgi:hypothetical protein
MSSAEKKTIDLKGALRDGALASAPSFPDFAQVYRKAEERPRRVRRFALSMSVVAITAVASFLVGIYWHSRSLSDAPLIDSWSSSVPTVPTTLSVGAVEDQQGRVVLASTQNSAVTLFVQDLWESSSGIGW